jgi:hypothetical protein
LLVLLVLKLLRLLVLLILNLLPLLFLIILERRLLLWINLVVIYSAALRIKLYLLSSYRQRWQSS